MTVIVGIVGSDGRVHLGADSQCTTGSTGRKYVEPKVWTQGPFVFGITGSPRQAHIVEHLLVLPERGSDPIKRWLAGPFVNALRTACKDAGYGEKDGEIEVSPWLVLGTEGRLFVMAGRYDCLEQDMYAAAGSGREYALGSLHTTAQYAIGLRQRMDLALQAACTFDIYCAAPFTYTQTNKHT